MNAEEQLRNMRAENAPKRNEIKNKIISLAMLAIAALCAVFGYKQQLEAKAQRNEVIRLHREIKRLTEESEASRMEAMKLRTVMERERKQTEAAMQAMQSKSKK